MLSAQKKQYLRKVFGDRRRFVNYYDGARLYSMRVGSFKKLAKEANAVYIIKRTSLVDMNVLENYMNKMSRIGVEE